ncbi:unnamed protein product [Rotaria sp. Silwood2]|nr:unnamed protein product [Rotaria sp. Silwood2]
MFLNLIVATPQINLHYTVWVSESQNHTVLQYDCLRVAAFIDEVNFNREIISYCMNDDWLLKFHIENNDAFPKFTFAELAKRKITSQQLYLWSAPIDVAERYEFYLNQLSTLNDMFLETQVFYNCTLPRFGSMCQYEITYHHGNYSSLDEIIHDYYRTYEYNPTNFTCYTHLKCNRGPFPACLDWSEICNGQVDCLDGEFDEEHCWQLEINECNDNEYRCTNGQCIPESFFRDDINTPDCLDGSDEIQTRFQQLNKYWSEICDAQVNCLDGEFDEEHCWQIEINECNDNEYRCTNGQCIPQSFFRDDSNTSDCLDGSDEIPIIFEQSYKSNKYIHQSLFKNGYCECKFEGENWCEDEDFHIQYARKNISFQTICDGFTELIPIIIEGQNETDETECEQWSCINIYTRCDGLWNCPHGEDEVGCDLSSTLNCSLDHHRCVSLHTNELICLPVKQANDGKIDCLGATDEPTLCQKKYRISLLDNFYCIHSRRHSCIDFQQLCNNIAFCDYEDDEKFCVKNRTNISTYDSICRLPHSSIRSDVEQFLCHETKFKIKQQIKYFSLDGMSKPVDDQTKNIIKLKFSSSSHIEMSDQHELRCHRGFDLRIWLNNEKNLTINTCLCPPSFYGDMCQYQNQRVSLTIKFRNHPHGEDEIGCYSFSKLNCSLDHHLCVLPDTNQLTCLSMETINDGKIDRLGVTDERALCPAPFNMHFGENFYCTYKGKGKCIPTFELCNNKKSCNQEEDKQFCVKNRSVAIKGYLCDLSKAYLLSDGEKFLCKIAEMKLRRLLKYFSLDGLDKDYTYVMADRTKNMLSKSSIFETSQKY